MRDGTGPMKPLSYWQCALEVAAVLVLLALAQSCSRGPEPQRLPKVEIEVGGRRIAVELARTPEQQTLGMKYRKTLGEDEGVLFVFPRDRNLAFYMKDTYVPLSIAFIRSDGVIANIARMEPRTTMTHRSRSPCRYAIEMPQGWFAAHGVNEGDRAIIPTDLGSTE